jgi:hypothetical protein
VARLLRTEPDGLWRELIITVLLGFDAFAGPHGSQGELMTVNLWDAI